RLPTVRLVITVQGRLHRASSRLRGALEGRSETREPRRWVRLSAARPESPLSGRAPGPQGEGCWYGANNTLVVPSCITSPAPLVHERAQPGARGRLVPRQPACVPVRCAAQTRDLVVRRSRALAVAAHPHRPLLVGDGQRLPCSELPYLAQLAE